MRWRRGAGTRILFFRRPARVFGSRQLLMLESISGRLNKEEQTRVGSGHAVRKPTSYPPDGDNARPLTTLCLNPFILVLLK